MKRSLLCLGLLASLAGVACGASGSSTDSSSGGMPSDASGAAAPGVSPGPGQGQGAQAGVLTAGVWDDNRNFDFFVSSWKRAHDKALPGFLASSLDEHKAAYGKFIEGAGGREQLDIALVIDTTGSMGDELSYLQKEFAAIASTVQKSHPDAAPRWALVVYRDAGDEYVTKSFDFSGNVGDFQQTLVQQSVNGGGDFPESPEVALAAASKLAWRPDSSAARMLFWVADAPHHQDKSGAMLDAIRGAQQQGVHIYPVASSGVDALTEISMRSAAQLTGGRYLFLTDDSGVGGSHKEPSIPCYFVTKLDRALLRMVDIELAGGYREPDASEVIRTGGSLNDGICKLDSGEDVHAFLARRGRAPPPGLPAGLGVWLADGECISGADRGHGWGWFLDGARQPVARRFCALAGPTAAGEGLLYPDRQRRGRGLGREVLSSVQRPLSPERSHAVSLARAAAPPGAQPRPG